MDTFFNKVNALEQQIKKDLRKAGEPFEEITIQVTVGRTSSVNAYIWINDDIAASTCYMKFKSLQQARNALVPALIEDREYRDERNN